jgi:hypothetical protein
VPEIAIKTRNLIGLFPNIPRRLRWSKPLLLGVLLSFPGLISAEQPHGQYRLLEWGDLVPEGWEPPLVAAAFDEVTASGVDPASVVHDLDG